MLWYDIPTLHLILNYKWYELIKSGKKRVEYRAPTPYWKKRLFNKHYEYVHFRKGYGRNAEEMYVEIKGKIAITDEPNDLGLPFVYKIPLGNYRIIKESCKS